MIVHSVLSGLRQDSSGSAWQCLVRRGMLFSECESIEYVSLPRGKRYAVGEFSGTEEAVLVLGGSLVAGGRRLQAGDVLVTRSPEILNATEPSEVILIVVLGHSASLALPPRIPELTK